MTGTLFLGRRADRLLDAPELELKSAEPITEFVDLSSYYIQPVHEGIRVLDGTYEVIYTDKKHYIHDVLAPGPFAMRMGSAYSTKAVRKYSVAASTLVGSNNPAAIVWDYLESGYSGVYFRGAYGSYHNSPLYFVSELHTGDMKVFSVTGNIVTGIVNDKFVTVTAPQGNYPVGANVALSWIVTDEEGNPHNPIILGAAQ